MSEPQLPHPPSAGGTPGNGVTPQPPQSRSSKSRVRSRPFYDNIPPTVSRERLDVILQNRKLRPAFISTPGDREGLRISKSGRTLTELEILQDKHEPEFRQVVPIVADALTAVVQQHSVHARTAPREERFAHYETNTVPGILVEDYVQRIAEYTYISPTTLVVTLIYLDRLCDRYPTLMITQINVFKLFFVAARVASKFNDLRTLNNKHFASVGGISNKHLNELEARLLIELRFDLFVSPNEFAQYAMKISASATSPINRTPSIASSSGAVNRVRFFTNSARGDDSQEPAPGTSGASPAGNGTTNGNNNNSTTSKP